MLYQIASLSAPQSVFLVAGRYLRELFFTLRSPLGSTSYTVVLPSSSFSCATPENQTLLPGTGAAEEPVGNLLILNNLDGAVVCRVYPGETEDSCDVPDCTRSKEIDAIAYEDQYENLCVLFNYWPLVQRFCGLYEGPVQDFCSDRRDHERRRLDTDGSVRGKT